MNTLRNFAALALLAFAAVSPAHAEDTVEGSTSAAVPINGPHSKEISKILQDKPEIAALLGHGSEEAIADALKAQLSERLNNEQGAAALAEVDNKEAITAALEQHLKDHPSKDGKDAAALVRDGKALAGALKARFK